MSKKKSALVRELEASLRLAHDNGGKFPKRDSLGNRLRHLDGEDLPDSLADPRTIKDRPSLSDLDAEELD